MIERSSTPSKVELVCIDPKHVSEVWPVVAPLIRAAVENVGLTPFSEIEYDVLSGEGLLWVIWSGREIEAAATTVLSETSLGKVCVLSACGGQNMRTWLPLFEQIENYARAERCDRMRIFGRDGWLRVLDGYSKTAIVIEKALG